MKFNLEVVFYIVLFIVPTIESVERLDMEDSCRLVMHSHRHGVRLSSEFWNDTASRGKSVRLNRVDLICSSQAFIISTASSNISRIRRTFQVGLGSPDKFRDCTRIAHSLRIYYYDSTYKSRIKNFAIHCSDGKWIISLTPTVLYSNKSRTEDVECKNGELLCGLYDNKIVEYPDLYSTDIQFHCCPITPTCVPEFTEILAFEYDNKYGVTEVQLSKTYAVGYTKDGSSNDPNDHEEILGLIKRTTQLEYFLYFYPNNFDDSSWSKGHTVTESIRVPPGVKSSFYQKIASCGGIKIHGSYIRREDDDSMLRRKQELEDTKKAKELEEVQKCLELANSKHDLELSNKLLETKMRNDELENQQASNEGHLLRNVLILVIVLLSLGLVVFCTKNYLKRKTITRRTRIHNCPTGRLAEESHTPEGDGSNSPLHK